METVSENRRVLVIDDDAGVRHAYGEIFAHDEDHTRQDELAGLASSLFSEPVAPRPAGSVGFSVTVTPQGEAAAAVAEKALSDGQPYAVAFVDMRMPPGWDGLKTISELWKRDPNLQAVICTAYSDYSWEEIIGRLGRSDRLLILKKPFDRIEVMQIAEALCAKWNLARAHEERTAELSRSRLRLRAIIDNDPALITLKDAEGAYLLANRAFCRRHALEESQVEGRRDQELFPQHQEQLRMRESAVASGAGYHETEEDDPRLPGARFLTARFMLNDNEGRTNAICTIATEITRLKDLEARFRQAQKFEALGRLAGGVAHDFNNLLAAIVGFSDLVLSQLPADDRHRRSLEQVIRAGKQAAGLTGQLLAFSRRQALKPQVIDLNAALLDQAMILKRLVGDAIQLHLATTPEPLPILIDPGQLQQVVVNLAVNSRDAMPQGGTLSIATATRGDQIDLTVADTGTGIAPEIIERIWDPFFTTKEASKGTGLGLATVQGVVVQSGGRIVVESPPGRGARFTLSFPRSTSMVPSSETAVLPASPVTRGQHVLIVDDNEAIRAFAISMLEGAGFRATATATGEEALAQATVDRVDLLISDVSMPVMGGPELVQRLRQRFPGLPALFITGFADRDVILGVPVLAKPFNGTDLVRAVRQALGR
jgi:two-component system, cell cycle sensor histidine kinase and response regulator CckA